MPKAPQDASPLDHQCPRDLRFTAYPYRNMTKPDGSRGHVVLARQTSATDPDGAAVAAAPLHQAKDSVRAEFGLGR